ncbi:putative E3 ubiquitin-protein ligase UBR7 isoform X2 [Nematostella vectensis]|nr:putative E3 ubiquitin-protein ligase UBR7 isoform X2 [Nematostella vectensis]
MEGSNLTDEVVSMVDVLQEDNELEEEANAVFGDSDDQQCTYEKGYVGRQALYACSTCSCPSSEPAGLCLACSLTCHDGHELYELYTKRNFRCDCGNSKFEGFNCKLFPDKDAVNKSNMYNQNFTGVYCTCHRPYPDPEDEIEDEMIQCIVCEDWYHSRHLGCLPPANGDYQEMICDSCMDRCTFLQAYLTLSVPSLSSLGPSQQVITKEEVNGSIEVGPSDEKPATKNDKFKKEKQDQTFEKNSKENLDKIKKREQEDNNPVAEPHYKDAQSSSAGSDSIPSESPCKLDQLQLNVTSVKPGASFWNVGWRAQLCTCTKCKTLYNTLGVSFLTSEQDTLVAYEARGQSARQSAYESGMQALGGMGRINQVEALHEYNNMKDELTDFLREFATQGKVVKPEDIQGFFESMQARKRQRVGTANTVQYSCK